MNHAAAVPTAIVDGRAVVKSRPPTTARSRGEESREQANVTLVVFSTSQWNLSFFLYCCYYFILHTCCYSSRHGILIISSLHNFKHMDIKNGSRSILHIAYYSIQYSWFLNLIETETDFAKMWNAFKKLCFLIAFRRSDSDIRFIVEFWCL